VQFKEPIYVAHEKEEQLMALVSQGGDINHKSTAHCYTHQSSAQVVMDYDERP